MEETEKLVIEYANLSGRESDNRAEFRIQAEKILFFALDRYAREVIKEILPEDGNLTMNEINNGYVLLSEIKHRADELLGN